MAAQALDGGPAPVQGSWVASDRFIRSENVIQSQISGVPGLMVWEYGNRRDFFGPAIWMGLELLVSQLFDFAPSTPLCLGAAIREKIRPFIKKQVCCESRHLS